MASKLKLTGITLAVLLGSVGVAAGLGAMKKPPEKKEEKDSIPVVVVEDNSVETITLNVNSYGLVNPKYQTSLTAQVTGQVTEISNAFVKGGFVKQGEVIARIDPNDYEAALTEAEASLAQARAALELERAQKRVAESEWERIKESAKNEFVPTELYLRKPQLAEKVARYRAAEAGVKRAKRNLERTYIKAPYDAIITARSVALGSVVNSGSPIGELSSTDFAEVRLPVADKELQFLMQGGLNAEVDLVTNYQGKLHHWQAKIVRSEGQVDNKSRMSYLVAEIKDPYGLDSNNTPLRYGSYVNAAISGLSIEGVSRVKSHLVKDGKVAVLEDGVLAYRSVEILREEGRDLIVKGDLGDNEQIIASNIKRPKAGMKLANAALASDIKPAKPVAELAMKHED
ncbi:efflux RND transporter periplasmic adaptor subunit [Pseudoalteromonas sp. MMG024]|uniref:efflux RND transporter periplasmic adaptor subunit n=1 Tax=Pseudoalteromonas sp. MMG024 TaxID=2909980 RepID=UPI001F02257A|nr:efflux RND transporter periplasmic adaptor subunit [Pseudoalteromonas sp. MMG024]MCF6455781.1 efflux RND transporter periplasmic adaptor subunit [Pseudoalteromonas sp. MMG024]